MAISFGPSNFIDKFDTNKYMATSSRADAMKRANAFKNSAMVGGEGVTQIANNEITDIMKSAEQSANSSAQGADIFGKVAGFAGGMGRIGFSEGGFGNFFNMGSSGGGGTGKLLEDPTTTFKGLNPGVTVFDMQTPG